MDDGSPLYKGVKRVQGATKKEFKEAVYSNLFWENFSEKKATFAKMLAFMIVMLLVFMTTIVIFAAAFRALLTHSISKRHLIYKSFFSPLAGLFPALLYLFLFQNNPILALSCAKV